MGRIFIESASMCGALLVLCVFIEYFGMFFEKRSNKRLLIVGEILFVLWQFILFGIDTLPMYLNLSMTILISFLAVCIIYIGKFTKKVVFVLLFNAMGMLMEVLCNYFLVRYFPEYAANQICGSIVSLLILGICVEIIKHISKNSSTREIPKKYNWLLSVFPVGSIYIMDTIFTLRQRENKKINVLICVFILIGLNILVIYIYKKLVGILKIQQEKSVFEHQLELCERHQQEIELSVLQIREIRHNIKNSLITILAYAENKENEKIIHIIQEILGKDGFNFSTVINTGNIVIDSLIAYWHNEAEKKHINFVIDSRIAIDMPFKNADIGLILGNLLENAVEAAEKAEGDKYIKIRMKYDKNNFLLFIQNNYNSSLIKLKGDKYKTTKQDMVNHGLGLPSVYQVAEKYHGSVIIDDSVRECFKISVLLYG